METAKDPIPVVRKGPDRKVVKNVEAIVNSFSKEMTRLAKKWVTEHGGVPAMPTHEDLLRLRTMLVEAVHEGMIGLQDQESKIGLIASLVWFMRLEEGRQTRILQEWG